MDKTPHLSILPESYHWLEPDGKWWVKGENGVWSVNPEHRAEYMEICDRINADLNAVRRGPLLGKIRAATTMIWICRRPLFFNEKWYTRFIRMWRSAKIYFEKPLEGGVL